MTVHSVSLRAGDARDVALVDALMAAFDPRYGEAWTRGQTLGVLAMPGVRLLLAEDEAGPAGFALTRTIMDEAELLLLAVAPDRRRRGVGGALLRAVIAACREQGAATLHLEVRGGNPAVELYAAHGFHKVGERRGYYRGRDGAQYDAHTYSRTL
ncbi:ribosomal-protein-alanine acetyltransferase [Sphingomonas metalli]|uniref:Ribosomal-protein-alanine acetyltransferase n=1 Tax=Sphingomonas metalli TaxID=1779358 RepID=A0A916SUK7_9SPHN|nr:GNAT family N-acetyltransferase [Sphingomonas metalli]GGB18652.1 ribosomal-protein-alanine acetyltransferase [Sphingomonas metalli]